MELNQYNADEEVYEFFLLYGHNTDTDMLSLISVKVADSFIKAAECIVVEIDITLKKTYHIV